MIINLDFKTIAKDFLKSIARDSERIPNLYFHKNFLLREFFWLRLRLIDGLVTKDPATQEKSCLDFGGGGGVFSPTLSQRYQFVDLVDLEVEEAKKVISHFDLRNVFINQIDIKDHKELKKKYDAVVAADVLEHFSNLHLPIQAIKFWLKTDGTLYTSLPTETGIYAFLRRVFGIQKPWDHYHTAWEVEKFLENEGFQKTHSRFHPLFFKISPLFSIASWKLRKIEKIQALSPIFRLDDPDPRI